MTHPIDQNRILDFVSTDLLHGHRVEADENLLLSGKLDSMAVVRLMLFLEEQFNLTIPPQDVTITNMASVDTMVAYLEKRRGESP